MSSRSIDKAIAAQRKKLRLDLVLQNYLTIPYTVSQSDMIATVPKRLALDFAEALGLQILDHPLKLPTLQNFIYWHEHKQDEPRHRWFRNLLVEIAASL